MLGLQFCAPTPSLRHQSLLNRCIINLRVLSLGPGLCLREISRAESVYSWRVHIASGSNIQLKIMSFFVVLWIRSQAGPELVWFSWVKADALSARLSQHSSDYALRFLAAFLNVSQEQAVPRTLYFLVLFPFRVFFSRFPYMLTIVFSVWLLERGCIVAQAILKLSYVAQVDWNPKYWDLTGSLLCWFNFSPLIWQRIYSFFKSHSSTSYSPLVFVCFLRLNSTHYSYLPEDYLDFCSPTSQGLRLYSPATMPSLKSQVLPG